MSTRFEAADHPRGAGGRFAPVAAPESDTDLGAGTFRASTTRDATGQQYDGQVVVAVNDLGDGTSEAQFGDGQWVLVDTAEIEPAQ